MQSCGHHPARGHGNLASGRDSAHAERLDGESMKEAGGDRCWTYRACGEAREEGGRRLGLLLGS